MEQKIAIMAVITGIAILGGSLAFASTLVSTSNNSFSTSQDTAGLYGHVSLVIYDTEGNVKKYIQGDNLITNNGENCIAELLTGEATSGTTDCKSVVSTASGPFKRVAIGTSGVAAATSDVVLGTAFKTKLITPTIASSTSTTDAIITWLATYTATGSQTFKESGIFDTSGTTRNMLAHKLFTTSATLTTGDTVAVTWNITVT